MSDDPASWCDANRRNWDERVPIHRRSAFYDAAGFLAGKSSLEPDEPEELGDVAGRSLLHLQCHFGMDTLSWARLGADVTGLDFSSEAVGAPTPTPPPRRSITAPTSGRTPWARS